MSTELLRQALAYFLITASCICLRTWAQAWVAHKRGDLAPAAQGRLTLNPMAHFDAIGTGLIPALSLFLGGAFGGSVHPPMLGWGKPFALSYPQPRKHVAHEVSILLGGLGMNLLLALGFAVLGRIVGGMNETAAFLCMVGIYVNIGLFVFHLLPFPPLDGAVLLRHLTKMSAETFDWLSRYGFLIFIVLMNFTPLGKLVMFVIVMLCQPYFMIMGIK